MKRFNELTKGGKYQRCKKALDLLQGNCHSGATLDRAVMALYRNLIVL